MNSQICVNCRNEKPVNRTDNRLVTENCGHVKCMDCLLQEKSGCIACLSDKSRADSAEASDADDGFAGDSVLIQTDIEVDPDDYDDKDIIEDLSKKKKLETSHIRVDSDESGNKNYICMLCKKKFRARSQVAYHAYCNGQSKPYECLQCDEKKTFASHSHYKYHMRVHRNERTYACEDCGQAFFQMSKLRRHRLKHTQAKDHVCKECNKAFNNESSLRKHALTHSGERPHACPVCARRFRDSSNLGKHINKKHNPEKCICSVCGRAGCSGLCGARRRHQCARCPQAFHSSKDLRRHAAVHTDSKPFRCKVCAKNFRRKDNLERHIRNTHPQHAPAAAVECDVTALKQINGTDYDTEQKIKLENLNPLPPLPLPQDLFKENTKSEQKIDSSYIMSANNARQSVIVTKSVAEKPPESPECEYVHKIRKANCHHVTLPPIDANKFAELDRKTNLDTLTVAEPPKHDRIFKKILCDDEGKEPEHAEPSPQVHWRKLKLNTN